jgi:hypothetical protein
MIIRHSGDVSWTRFRPFAPALTGRRYHKIFNAKLLAAASLRDVIQE